MQRIAIVIQYIGTHFHGWQRQPQHRSVQEDIETAIAQITGHPTPVHGAGRTDSGVHAAAQVAHFDCNSPIPAEKWATVLNNCLADDVLILASTAVPSDWHARFSAAWRRYRYTFYTHNQPNLFIKPFCWHYYHAPLNLDQMQAALDPLVGHHDLAAFRRAGSNRKHSWVEVHEATLKRQGAFLCFEIQANGFLYGMVRLLVGMLVLVGNGTRSPLEFTQVWKNQQRELVKYSAPAKGLCLLRVGYPDFPLAQEIWFDTQPQFILNTSF